MTSLEKNLLFELTVQKMISAVENTSDLISLQKAANHSGDVLRCFVADRRVDSGSLFSIDFPSFFQKCSEIIHRDPARYMHIMQAACFFAGNLSFIRWKKISCFRADQLYIFNNFIRPVFYLDFCKETGKVIAPRVGRRSMLYLPNVSPLGVGIANSTSAREFISQYASANSKGYTENILFVGVEGKGVSADALQFDFVDHCYGLRPFFYADFKGLTSFIMTSKPDVIILDYFTYPWNFLPRLFPETQFVYRSWGFNLFISRNCSLILGSTSESASVDLINSARALIPGFRIDHVRVPRSRVAKAVTTESHPRIRETIRITEAVRNQKSFYIFGTFCRGTKISRRFASAVSEILRYLPESIFIGAGTGVLDTLELFDEGIRNRVILFDNVEPEHVLKDIDVYLETFPEHQGMAALEALNHEVPVVSLNASDASHILLNERLAECVVGDVDSYVTLALALAQDHSRAQCVRNAQRRVAENAYEAPEMIWTKYERAIESRLA